MKKTIALILAVVMMLSIVTVAPFSATAAEVDSAAIGESIVSSDGLYEYAVLDDGTAKLTKYLGNSTLVEFPNYIDGYNVTTIGSYVFDTDSNVETVVLSYYMTTICDYAFYGLDNLVTVRDPHLNRIRTIGNYAFANCPRLSYIYFSHVETLGDSVFSGCSGLVSVDLGDYVTSIGKFAFYSCSSLTSIEISTTVASVGDYAFSNCSSLPQIILPESVEYIGNAAFSNCTGLQEITINNPDCYIYQGYNTLPQHTTIIAPAGSAAEQYANDCGKNYERLTDPEADEEYTCGDFTYRVLSDTTVEIAGYIGTATDINIPSTLNGYKVTAIGEEAFYDLYDKMNITRVTIPDGVTAIKDLAFYACDNLEYINVPDTVTKIGEHAFYGCRSLENITIPSGIKFIEDYAFDSCDSLTQVVIPYGVTSIGYCSFGGCDSLSSVTIPDTVTCIDALAFTSCVSLTSIEIPSSVAYIGVYGFSHSGLVEVTIPEGVKCIGERAFTNCQDLTRVTVSGSVNTIDYYVFAFCPNLTTVELLDGVSVIEEKAFADCFALTSVSFPNTLTSIGTWAFGDCESLEYITIPDSVTTIEDDAFGATGLKEVTVPASVTYMGYSVFVDCTQLEKAEILANISTLPSSTFYRCYNFTDYVLADNITTIGYQAFAVTGLTETGIPETVKYIDDNAFASCSELEKVVVDKNVEVLGDSVFRGSAAKEIYIYNPECEIYDSQCTFGYINEYDDYSVERRKVYGYTNSTAQKYAEKYSGHYEFIPLDKERPEKVENFHAEEITHNSFTLEWDPVEGASLYVVYNMVNGIKYKSTTDTSLVIPNRKVGTTYKYAVIAIFDDGTEMDLTKADVLELEVEAYIKNIKVIDVDKFSATLTWDEVEGAEYVIYINGNKYLRVKEPQAVVDLKYANTQYYIRIIAFFPGRPDNEQFLLNDAKGVTVITDPLGEITSETSLTITIPEEVKEARWNDGKCAYDAWLMFGTDKNNLTSKHRFLEFESDTYTVSELEYGTEYYYYFRYFTENDRVDMPVTAVKTEENEIFDDIDLTYTDEGKLVINWNVVNGATMYWVYVDGTRVSKQADNSAVTVDNYKDGATVTIKAQYEYKKGRFKMFDYEPAIIKKP